MKKIVFVVINMNVGGTEKALLSLIDQMDKDKWDITILMLEEYGDLIEDIPQWVKVKYIKEYENLKSFIEDPPMVSVKNFIKENNIKKGLSVALNYGISKASKSLLHWYKYILKNVEPLEEVYDVAVAYAGPMDLITLLVHSKINAQKKVQWIHFDITKIAMDKKIVKEVYSKFDKILVVSEEGKVKFICKFPSVKSITEVRHNVISKDKILKAANEGESFQDNFDGTRILTVGRLNKEKGQDLVIPVLARLKEEGYKVRWYCIGDGTRKEEYMEIIEKYNLQNDFILLGSKKNPYPYMKDCDIYVQPSRHEGYCITLAEARCFNKPIIATDFTGAREQIELNGSGTICEISEEGIYKSVKSILGYSNLNKIS